MGNAESEPCSRHAREDEACLSASPDRTTRTQSCCDCTLDFRTFLRESSVNVFDAYKRIGDLGEGAFGDVWLAQERIRAKTANETVGRLVAVKRVRKPNSEVNLDDEDADSAEAIVDFRTEVELMRSLDHPSICRLMHVHEDAKNIFLVMEHIKGQELFQRVSEMGSFGEEEAAQVIRQSASALGYCHSRGVVHRDIKPENILVMDPIDCQEGQSPSGRTYITAKLIDFGFGCRILAGAKLKAKVGTFMYTAPEVLKGEDCDEAIDNWALGCVLYSLLSGLSPFYGSDVKDRIIKGKYAFDDPMWEPVSDCAKDVIRGLLVVDPRRRLKAKDLHGHPWLHHEHHLRECRPSLSNAMDNIRDFHRQSCLRHLATGVLARQLDESAIHDLHHTFAELDQDDDGILTVAEFRSAWKELGVTMPDDLQDIFADMDMDGSGQLDYTEFLAACMDRKVKEQEETCWSAFRVFDVNGNGKISFQELHQVVNSASVQATFPEEKLQELWRELTGVEIDDHTSLAQMEGEVDFDHFMAAMGGKAVPPTSPEEKQEAPAGAAATSGGGLPIAGRGRARGGDNSGGLPICRRGGCADEACGDKAGGGGAGGGGLLPLAGRRRPAAAAAEQATTAAPDVGAVGGGGLPIMGRRRPLFAEGQGTELPTQAAAPAPVGLPIMGRRR